LPFSHRTIALIISFMSFLDSRDRGRPQRIQIPRIDQPGIFFIKAS
jgi:hypothetical protein